MNNRCRYCGMALMMLGVSVQASYAVESTPQSAGVATETVITLPTSDSVDTVGSTSEMTPEVTSTGVSATDVFVSPDKEKTRAPRGYLSPANEWNTSIMFSTTLMYKLRQVVLAYEQNKEYLTPEVTEENTDIDDILSDNSKKIEGPLFPAFYLASIVYYKPDDWAVWVNGKRISHYDNNEMSDIYVKSVNEKTAHIVWRPMKMDKMATKWEQALYKRYTQKNGESIAIDDTKGTIGFTLKPNQSFDSRGLKVIEGKKTYAQIEQEAAMAEGMDQIGDLLSLTKEKLSGVGTEKQDPEASQGEEPSTYDPSISAEKTSQELIDRYQSVGKLMGK